MIKLTDAGGTYIMNRLFKGPLAMPTTLTLKLCVPAVPLAASNGAFLVADGSQFYTASTTPTDANGNATLAETSGGGYVAQTMAANDSDVFLSGDIPCAEWPLKTFTFTGNVYGNAAIWGYHIVADDVDKTVLFEGLFSAPFTPPDEGGNLRLTPRVLLGNGTPS